MKRRPTEDGNLSPRKQEDPIRIIQINAATTILYSVQNAKPIKPAIYITVAITIRRR